MSRVSKESIPHAVLTLYAHTYVEGVVVGVSGEVKEGGGMVRNRRVELLKRNDRSAVNVFLSQNNSGHAGHRCWLVININPRRFTARYPSHQIIEFNLI